MKRWNYLDKMRSSPSEGEKKFFIDALISLTDLLEEVNNLDAQYLTGYPEKLPRATYLRKRNALRKEFEALKLWVQKNR